MAAPALTTEDKVTRRVSQLGVDLRTDHDPDNVLADVVADANAEVAFYLQRYAPAGLTSSPFAATAATDVAVFRLACVRMETPPEQVVAQYERIVALLTLVLEGKAQVPGVAAGRGSRPTVTNQRVALDRYPPLRVERARSTGTAEGYTRRTDPTTPPVY